MSKLPPAISPITVTNFGPTAVIPITLTKMPHIASINPIVEAVFAPLVSPSIKLENEGRVSLLIQPKTMPTIIDHPAAYMGEN